MDAHDDNHPTSQPWLTELASADGPFATLLLGPGANVTGRAQMAIDHATIPAPYAGRIMSALTDDETRSQVIIVDGAAQSTAFVLDDPLAFDVARFGVVPSLGVLMEMQSMTAHHVAITIEDDVYAITSFGSPVTPIASPASTTPDVPPIFESIDLLAERLSELAPEMLAVIGAESEVDIVVDELRNRLDLQPTYVVYPTDDIDADLMEIADEVVRDAATAASERLTHDLAHFRQARLAGQAVEGAAVLNALRSGAVRQLLVHDDITAERESVESIDGTRAVDQVIAEGLILGVDITMIPSTPAERGPEGGMGAILTDVAEVEVSAPPLQAVPSDTAEARPVPAR